MDIRKTDVCVSSVRLCKYVRDLAKTLENGEDVGFHGDWW